MIIGMGVDIVKLERIESLYEKHGKHFLEKILSAEEISLLPEKFPVPYIGGRFAVKEALVKAIGARDFEFNEISVLKKDNGAPFISDLTKLEQLLNMSHNSLLVHISISHETDYCIANVIIEQNQ